MAMMGTPDGPPVRFGVAMVDIATGMALVSGVLAAALERTRTGAAGTSSSPSTPRPSAAWRPSSLPPASTPRARAGAGEAAIPRSFPYSAFEVSDGFVVLGRSTSSCGSGSATRSGSTQLLADPRAATNDRAGQQPRLGRDRVPRRSPACRRRGHRAARRARACSSRRSGTRAWRVDRPPGRRARPDRRDRRHPLRADPLSQFGTDPSAAAQASARTRGRAQRVPLARPDELAASWPTGSSSAPSPTPPRRRTSAPRPPRRRAQPRLGIIARGTRRAIGCREG